MQAANLQEPPSHCVDVVQRVVDHPSLVRQGAAVINTDNRGYQEALARRRALLAREARTVALEESVANLGGELAEIKEMLKCLLKTEKTL